MPVAPASVREIDLFAALSPADPARRGLHARATHSAERDHPAGRSARRGFYYVQTGLIKVYRTSAAGRVQVLRLLGPGETFNDVPALDSGPNPASAAAMEPSVVYILGQDQLRRLIVERPEVADAAIKRLSLALRHLVSVVGDLSFLHVNARLAKALIEQEQAIAAGRRTRYFTQLELAAITGTTREIVARVLSAFEALGAARRWRSASGRALRRLWSHRPRAHHLPGDQPLVRDPSDPGHTTWAGSSAIRSAIRSAICSAVYAAPP